MYLYLKIDLSFQFIKFGIYDVEHFSGCETTTYKKDNAKNTNYKKQYWNLRLYGLALDRIKYVLELWEYTQL